MRSIDQYYLLPYIFYQLHNHGKTVCRCARRFPIASVKVDIRRAKMLMTTWQYLDGIELISIRISLTKSSKRPDPLEIFSRSMWRASAPQREHCRNQLCRRKNRFTGAETDRGKSRKASHLDLHRRTTSRDSPFSNTGHRWHQARRSRTEVVSTNSASSFPSTYSAIRGWHLFQLLKRMVKNGG